MTFSDGLFDLGTKFLIGFFFSLPYYRELLILDMKIMNWSKASMGTKTWRTEGQMMLIIWLIETWKKINRKINEKNMCLNEGGYTRMYIILTGFLTLLFLTKKCISPRNFHMRGCSLNTCKLVYVIIPFRHCD